MKNKFLSTYENRWKKAISSGEDDIISFGRPKTQIQFFYKEYCKFIAKEINNTFKNREISELNLIEIGCGRGTATIYLEKVLGMNCYGVDFSEESIKIANRNRLKYSSKAKFIKGNIFDMKNILKKLNFQEKNFDVVISLGVLEHMEEIDECFSFHRMLLRENGLFLAMIVPEKFSIQNYFSIINQFLLKLQKNKNKKENLAYLDKKTLSKTADVYRSYEDEKFYKRKLELSGFINVSATQANPFPLIRPLNKNIEEFLTFFYICLKKFYSFIFRKSLFFGCSKNLSRCHFLKGFVK